MSGAPSGGNTQDLAFWREMMLIQQPFPSLFLREKRRRGPPRRASARQAENYVFLEAGLTHWLSAELGMGSEACRLQTGRGSGKDSTVQF